MFLFFLSVPAGVSKAQDSAYARSIINKLTSKGMQGRGYVNRGQEKAAAFIRKEFKSLGLKSFTSDYYQEFSFPVNTFRNRQKLRVNGLDLKAGKDFLVDPSSPSLSGFFAVRDSMTSSEIHLYEGEMPVNRESGHQKATIAWLKVPGTLVLHHQNGSESGRIKVSREKLSWSVALKQNKIAGMNLQVADTMMDIQNLQIAILSRMKTSISRNVSGYIEGTERPDSMIFFTAHYDHLGKMGKDVLFPGANDNASGVALMLDIARYYSTHPPRYTMVFLASAAEEAGILGSMYYCEHPLTDLSRIRFLLNIDLAGTGSEGIMVVNATIFPKEFTLLKELNTKETLLTAVKTRGEACNSDHCAFYRKGVPCFFIYTMGGITFYHDTNDRAATLPLDCYENYCRLLLRFSEALQAFPPERLTP